MPPATHLEPPGHSGPLAPTSLAQLNPFRASEQKEATLRDPSDVAASQSLPRWTVSANFPSGATEEGRVFRRPRFGSRRNGGPQGGLGRAGEFDPGRDNESGLQDKRGSPVLAEATSGARDASPAFL